MTVLVRPKSEVADGAAVKQSTSRLDENDNVNETCCTNEGASPRPDDGAGGPTMRNRAEVAREPSTSSSTSSKHRGPLHQQQQQQEDEDDDDRSDAKDGNCLLPFNDAPEHLKHNTYIRSGYRGFLDTQSCIESIFWWTNETVNIWSHIFGFLLFLGLTIYDLSLLKLHATFLDKFLVAVLLICFQACMALSTMYHVFSCRSEHDYNFYLSFDLFGIALSLLAIYMTGIYYAFWCHPTMLSFYLVTVSVIFVIAIAVQHPKFCINSNAKLAIFVSWAAYGVVPTLHWTKIMGGFRNPVVNLLLPRVLGMYAISGTAFFIYITKIPERFFAGKFDYLGHSHQWWHLFVVFALYYWHNTGMMYIEYRMNHACSDTVPFP